MSKSVNFFILGFLSLIILSCANDECPEISVADLSFTIDENSAVGTQVGVIDNEASFTGFEITSGNTGEAFTIDNEGRITVSSASALNYEENESFELVINGESSACGDTEIIAIVSLNDEVDEIYRDPVFSEVTVDESVVYGDSDPEQQIMNVFYPTNSQERRPLLVIARGGGYSGGDLGFLNDIGNTLAKAGYVVAAINYLTDPENKIGNFTRDLLAAQDIRAAVRYFRRDAAEEDIYKVNVNNIFHGGFSSGGNRAFEMAYQDQSSYSDFEWSLITSSFGGLEGERGNPGYSSDTKAILNMGGSTARINWMDSGEIPIICIHSDNDPEVPYDTGNGRSGSKAMTDRAEELNIPNKLVTIVGPPLAESHNAPAFCIECYDEVLKFFSRFLE